MKNTARPSVCGRGRGRGVISPARACPPSCLTRAGVHRLMGMHTQKAQKHHTNTRHETQESAPPLHLSLSTSRHPELIQTAFGRDGG